MRKAGMLLAILFLSGMLSGCCVFAGDEGSKIREMQVNYYETYVQDPDYSPEDLTIEVVHSQKRFSALCIEASEQRLLVRWLPMERVCGYDFEYDPGSILLIYNSGRFYSLLYAEHKGILSEGDVKTVYEWYLDHMKEDKGGGQ